MIQPHKDIASNFIILIVLVINVNVNKYNKKTRLFNLSLNRLNN